MASVEEFVSHLCRVHTDEPLVFVCLTETCFARGLLCFQCRLDKHIGPGHVIRSIDQLRNEAAKMTSEEPTPKDAKQECFMGIRETSIGR